MDRGWNVASLFAKDLLDISTLQTHTHLHKRHNAAFFLTVADSQTRFDNLDQNHTTYRAEKQQTRSPEQIWVYQGHVSAVKLI